MVRDVESSEAMDDVIVSVAGTTRGTLSEPDGSFVLREVPPGRTTLRFQRIGHDDLRVEMEMEEGRGLEVGARMSIQRIPICGDRVCGPFGCHAVEAFVRDDATGSAPLSAVTIRVIGGIAADSLTLRADPGEESLRIGAGGSLVRTGPSVDRGPYEVEIWASGYLPWRRDVRRGECLEVEGSPFQVRLMPIPAPGFGGMSGGERQRATLAMALLRRPVCLLMDEPFAGVAPKDRAGRLGPPQPGPEQPGRSHPGGGVRRPGHGGESLGGGDVHPHAPRAAGIRGGGGAGARRSCAGRRVGTRGECPRGRGDAGGERPGGPGSGGRRGSPPGSPWISTLPIPWFFSSS